jgi:hypothetical protein
MRIKMKRLHPILTLLLIAAATTMTLARADIRVDKDPKFDFTKLKTFGWNAVPGEVKIWVTQASNEKAEPTKQKFEPVLMQAAETAMTKLGYAKAAGAAPDFEMIYYVLITTGSTSQHMGQFLPTNAQWGIPLWSPNTTALAIYPTGAMVLDVTVGGKMVWRGISEAKVEMAITDEQRAKRVTEFITKLVEKFPKVPKK